MGQSTVVWFQPYTRPWSRSLERERLGAIMEGNFELTEALVGDLRGRGVCQVCTGFWTGRLRHPGIVVLSLACGDM
jgi:hypothetical protein